MTEPNWESATERQVWEYVALSVFDEKIPEVMKTIGFKKSVGRHYVHPKCKLFVEFVAGSAGIGDDIQIKSDEKAVYDLKSRLLEIKKNTCCTGGIAAFKLL